MGEHRVAGVAAVLVLLFVLAPTARGQESEPEADAVGAVARAMPISAEQFDRERISALRQAVRLVLPQAAHAAFEQPVADNAAWLARVELLVARKSRIDKLVDRALDLRGGFAKLPEGPARRERVKNYLQATSALIDTSARMRYLLFDVISSTADRLSDSYGEYRQLVDILLRHHSSIGASVLATDLLAPPPVRGILQRRASLATKHQLLKLIAATHQADVLPTLADLALDPQTPPGLILATAETIRTVGLPQEPRPGQDASLPPPPIVAAELADAIEAIGTSRLTAVERRQRDALLGWLKQRAAGGIAGDTLRLARGEVRAGDWLLMRNPSPYNLFTDLSPGLFTHVGIITVEQGTDGRRRMVLADLPERGKKMQVTNLDLFVQRTRHYVVLRHTEAAVGRKMGEVARSILNNPTQFDLNFRTQRVAALKGQPLAGRTIHTYCAGLLLLCAQETGVAREVFFPIPEYPAEGNTVANLEKLGITFGKDFVSPTGALFSPQLTIVCRRDPMYDPGREIEELIYDHFANRLIDGDLRPSPDLFQSLRLKLAEAGRTNPLLARALAGAAGVREDVDLVSAAKAAAVVESLDEIARRGSAAFSGARTAIVAGPEEGLRERGFGPEEIEAIKAYRHRHAPLFQAVVSGQLSPRHLRMRLVDYYSEKGRHQIDARFFDTGSP